MHKWCSIVLTHYYVGTAVLDRHITKVLAFLYTRKRKGSGVAVGAGELDEWSYQD